MTCIDEKIAEMTKGLKNAGLQRQQELKTWKGENKITPTDVKEYGRSDHVQVSNF